MVREKRVVDAIMLLRTIGHDFTHTAYLETALPGTRLFKRIHASLPVVSSGLLTKNLKVSEVNVFYLTSERQKPMSSEATTSSC